MTKNILLISSLAVIALALLFIAVQSNTATGAGYLGFASHLQTATTTTVGPDTIVTLASDDSSGACKARVVSTVGGSAIMLSFDDTSGFGSTTISGAVGHWQAASTTVAYDSGIYGCGLMTAYGYSSTTITVSQF